MKKKYKLKLYTLYTVYIVTYCRISVCNFIYQAILRYLIIHYRICEEYKYSFDIYLIHRRALLVFFVNDFYSLLCNSNLAIIPHIYLFIINSSLKAMALKSLDGSFNYYSLGQVLILLRKDKQMHVGCIAVSRWLPFLSFVLKILFFLLFFCF